LGFVERCPEHHCLSWKTPLAVNHDCIPIVIMMDPLLDHFRPGWRRDLCHLVIVDIDRDRSRRQDFRSNGCVAALRKLAHNVIMDILIRHLLLAIQGDRKPMPQRISNARPSHYTKGLLVITRHHK
jgi:hypothetical protein